MKKAWRDAATLILVARNSGPNTLDMIPPDGNIFDYKVLMQKRSSNSKFMVSQRYISSIYCVFCIYVLFMEYMPSLFIV